jgi:glycine betaine transporter
MIFLISVSIILAFVLWGIIAPTNFYTVSQGILDMTIEKFGWFYLLATFGILVFCIYIAFSKYNKIRLGNDDDKPQYANITWFGMLFSAGMGIGLVFWGVAEPVFHYINPPLGIEPETAEAARAALRYSFFHWGLHPWGVYTLIGLAIAYFNYRKGCKGLISSTFYPILGEKVNGPIGKTIDILTIIATAFGVATSLGLGALQINSGLNEVIGLPVGMGAQVIIIAIVTVLFLISATTGLDKGIKILSNTNIIIAISLMVFVLFAGPTSFIFDVFTLTIGGYLQNVIQMSFRLTPFTQATWISQWTLFYWAWWISWSPFVGMFIARVSKGRTIKEFVLGVLLIPSGFSFIWFSVFGGTALNLQIIRGIDVATAVQSDVSTALFATLRHLPAGTIISVIATLLIITFFITSADSATFVLGMFSSDGNQNPSNKVKITWGILQSSIAVTLLFSGGLEALQTTAIISALPFTVIMVFICYSFKKALEEEKLK